MQSYERGAREILDHINEVYVPSHKYVQVDPREFRHLNLKFYESVKTELLRKGFTHLSDEEDTTLSNARGGLLRRVMIRTMISSDGSVMVGAYHAKIKPLWRILLFLLRQRVPGPTVDFETEFENGAFLATTNAGEAVAAMTQPPMILMSHLPAGTPVEEMRTCHLERIQAYQELQGVRPLCFSSREEVIESQNRMNALKSVYRLEIGGITAEELAKLSAGHLDVAARMHDKIAEARTSAGVSERAV